jgi:cytochrome c oxidase cbb3-type subunit III
MFRTLPTKAAAVCCCGWIAAWLAGGIAVAAAQEPPTAAMPPTGSPPGPQVSTATPDQNSGPLLYAPVNTFIPGAANAQERVDILPLDDPAAPQRGMMAFNAFNCVGCHMGNGGGGMGPALSESSFIYGNSPQDIYLTIVQGRPHGMPAWGSLLPTQTVWDLVAYIRNLSKAPDKQWGTTVSATSPAIEQVPAENNQSPNPWQQTEPFKPGQKP